MSKTIQEALNLPVLEDLIRQSDTTEVSPSEDDELLEMETLVQGDIIIQVDEAEKKDYEQSVDEIHKEVFKHAKDLMDLGFNVDTRSAPKIFDAAANMFKLALESKNSKREAQFREARLMLDEKKLDLAKRTANSKDPNAVIENEADDRPVIVEDRNELLRQLRDTKK